MNGTRFFYRVYQQLEPVQDELGPFKILNPIAHLEQTRVPIQLNQVI